MTLATIDHDQSHQLAHRSETAATAQAAQAEAVVQAQYLVAYKHPRSTEVFRQEILKDCKRPGFAKTARFAIPYRTWDKESRQWVEKPIVGWTIRFAEAALGHYRNVVVRSACIFDDKDKRILAVSLIDLEKNIAYSVDVTVEKVVERKKLKDGQVPIDVRQNTYGDEVYLLPANERDVRQREGAEISKAIRTMGLRLIPADILEECLAQVLTTQTDEDARDPDAARRATIDEFGKLGVKASELEQLLGHSPDSMTPAEIVKLRAYGQAIRDGMASWKDVLECETTTPQKGEEDPQAELRSKVAARLDQQKQKQQAAGAAGQEGKGSAPGPTKGGRGKAKPAEQRAGGEPHAAEDPVAAVAKAAGVDAAKAKAMVEQGWEVAETGELVPPREPGSGG